MNTETPSQEFYDATDMAGLVYRHGMAEGLYYQDTVERQRRGQPAEEARDRRCCGGYIVWKFNDSWPQIHSWKLDFFLEPSHAYYALRRAYTPVMLSFDIGTFICNAFADIERRLTFPEAKLKVRVHNAALVITTDAFASAFASLPMTLRLRATAARRIYSAANFPGPATAGSRVRVRVGAAGTELVTAQSSAHVNKRFVFKNVLRNAGEAAARSQSNGCFSESDSSTQPAFNFSPFM